MVERTFATNRGQMRIDFGFRSSRYEIQIQRVDHDRSQEPDLAATFLIIHHSHSGLEQQSGDGTGPEYPGAPFRGEPLRGTWGMKAPSLWHHVMQACHHAKNVVMTKLMLLDFRRVCLASPPRQQEQLAPNKSITLI